MNIEKPDARTTKINKGACFISLIYHSLTLLDSIWYRIITRVITRIQDHVYDLRNIVLFPSRCLFRT